MAETQTPPAAKPRYVYIDLLRGWAVLVMIETHVFNAFMQPLIRETPWFRTLNFINGIVAPSFLFVAGYSFALVGQRKWNDYLRLQGVFWKQVGRILQIWIVGYALHLPFFSFNKLAYLIGWEEWRPFWGVDVLHCIAFSLMLMLLLVVMGRTKKVFLTLVAVVGVLVVFTTPLLWSANVDNIFALPFTNYINAQHGSLFPLFPWLGFVFFGGAVGQVFPLVKERMGEKKFFKYTFIAGIVCIVVSIIAELQPLKLYPPHEFWRASPGFFLIRLGIVLIIFSTLWLWEQTAKSGRSVVSLLGSESLVTYSGHLLIIYGLFWGGRSLSEIIRSTRSVPEVAGMTVLLIGAMAATAFVWNSLKKKSMLYARVLQYTILTAVLYVFFTKLY